MIVSKIQTETTFDVDFEGESGYTVTIMEDFTTGHIHWNIIDEHGNQVEDEDVIEQIVAIIEANRD